VKPVLDCRRCELIDSRRKFLTVATSATAAVGVIFAATPSSNPGHRPSGPKALGVPISVPPLNLEPGQMLTYGYGRLKPIYIIRRTAEMVAQLSLTTRN